ncbi:hypothetical protein GGR51DRAFT_574195 [Nemania sp. FL0031]|nr:hypothetical protein GGR51DRAFT_574195 [Nemania sp. FL0031]
MTGSIKSEPNGTDSGCEPHLEAYTHSDPIILRSAVAIDEVVEAYKKPPQDRRDHILRLALSSAERQVPSAYDARDRPAHKQGPQSLHNLPKVHRHTERHLKLARRAARRVHRPDHQRHPLTMDTAIKSATGHESMELLKIGYMLLVFQDSDRCTTDDLERVASGHWLMPTNDLDLIVRIRAVVARLCRFGDHLALAGLLNSDNKSINVDLFLEELENSQQNPKLWLDSAPSPLILSISAIKAILCGEIWCVLIQLNLPPPVEKFIERFGCYIAEGLEFLSKLTFVLQDENVCEYCLGWYRSDNIAMLRWPSALKALSKDWQEHGHQ